MAERVGFEPTCPFGQDAFEAPPLRPLRYLSVEASCAEADRPLYQLGRDAGIPRTFSSVVRGDPRRDPAMCCGPSLQSGEVLGDSPALLVGEAPSQGAHDVCPIIASRAALELRQLLDDVGLTLSGQAWVLLVARSIGLVTADTRWHTAGAIAFLVQHFAPRRQLLIRHCAPRRGLTGVVGCHGGNLVLLQSRDHGSHDGALALAGLVLAQLL